MRAAIGAGGLLADRLPHLIDGGLDSVIFKHVG
jgi:hypothetical protein